MKAFCWASGLIHFGPYTPKGAITIADSADAKALRDLIEGTARHGYETVNINGRLTKVPGSEHLLVPGLPEAKDQTAAAEALSKWMKWIGKNAPASVRVHPCG